MTNCKTNMYRTLKCTEAKGVGSNYSSCMSAINAPSCDVVLEKASAGQAWFTESCQGVILF